MNNLAKRILLAVVALPLLIVLIFILPHNSHLLLNILILALSVIGGLEARNLFTKRKTILSPVKTAIFSGIFPLFSIFIVMGLLSEQMIIPLLAISIGILFMREALMRDKDLIQSVLERLPAYCFLLIFPGFFISFLIRLNIFAESSLMLVIFLTFVFSNDTFAYFSGMLFGQNSRGIFPVSAKKSLAGLIGGLTAAGIAGYIYFIFFPHIFKNNPAFAILTGLGIGFTSVIGDLVESALKRSADEKDSGTLMGGRGGVLDSIDSILFSAPLYYYIMLYMQN
ncbi:MAG: phosphatidate cytidylyltransferase [Spirochaetales bacterium]|uniref:Phosphatidate cytidylyltransferase n=1 Tax=Candidatus Thalassospirochaeta sargassi TaxID=3119039 RepID=A0AAJ1IDW0_9SPIO|nr:phosphatidate cytidylyltransferase [Spirochaetales bacterium]